MALLGTRSIGVTAAPALRSAASNEAWRVAQSIGASTASVMSENEPSLMR